MEWMKKCYSRLLIDNHITDINQSFMCNFDSAEYIRMVKRSGVDSAMVYACDHNGNCYYPTRIGHQHANINKCDLFGKIVSGLRREKIVPIAYYTVVFHNHSARKNPSWRMRDVCGTEHSNRYWHSCPNSEDYVQFTLDQLAEIVAYDVDGIFIDMTFWPKVCFCASCRKRYLQETGMEIPEVIDWSEPHWVSFQRMRESWMAEFANRLTSHVKNINKCLTVTHQFSPVFAGWFLGQSAGIPEATDYASGDFYGDKYQHRLGTKVFTAFSKEMPYEFMASRCVNLNDHTSSKSEDELFLHAGTTLANGGAYFFIDAINSDGTLNPKVYEMFGNLNKRLQSFKECVATNLPVLDAECSLYFSMQSLVDTRQNGMHLKTFSESGSNMDTRDNPVVEELTGTSILFNRMHVPYTIAVRPEQIVNCKTLVVNNCGYLSREETETIRAFVQNGGTLIATGLTSLYDTVGNSNGNFTLADVFGVDYTGTQSESVNYLDLEAGNYISNNLPSPCTIPTTARVVYHLAGTDFPANDAMQYASIHSNPPGETTNYIGLSVNQFGKGTCYYIAPSFMRLQQYSQQSFAEAFFQQALPKNRIQVKGLSACVEVTTMKSTMQNVWLIGLVNYPHELPAASIHQPIEIDFMLDEKFIPKTVKTVSDNREIEFTFAQNLLRFSIDNLDLFQIIEIKSK